MAFLQQAWYQRKLWLYLLWPLAMIYRVGNLLHRLIYQLNLKHTIHFSVPIIVVGNITVGGTGKTPLVIALSQYLHQQGYRPGIVSRGYKAKVKKFPVMVTADSDPEQMGDEPVLIAARTHFPVAISPSRVEAVTMLIENCNCNIIISDDGLQHYALASDIQIIVIDGERRFSNGLCLPAGPLRESLRRLRQVDFLVCNGAAQADEIAMSLQSDKIYNLKNPGKTLTIANIVQPVYAVAGIGNPERFFKQLRAMGLNIIPRPFPDHYRFKASDIDFGAQAIVIMTEKDAVKCRKFASYDHWYVPVTATVDEKFYLSVLRHLAP